MSDKKGKGVSRRDFIKIAEAGGIVGWSAGSGISVP